MLLAIRHLMVLDWCNEDSLLVMDRLDIRVSVELCV